MENATRVKFGYRLSVIGYRKNPRTENRTPRTEEAILLRLFLLMLSCVFIFGGCGKRGAGEKRSAKIEAVVRDESIGKEEEDIDVKQKVHNFKLEGFSKSGENQWYIEGEFAKIIESNIFLSKIKSENFGKDMHINLTADEGVYDRVSGSTELSGNVIISTSDGGTLTMERANWESEKEEVHTESYVVIVHSGIILQGRGGIVNPKKHWAILNKEIKVMDLSDRVITCDGPLEVYYDLRKVIFNNNVEINEPQGKMIADKLIAYFDPEQKKIEKIEWLGNVKAIY